MHPRRDRRGCGPRDRVRRPRRPASRRCAPVRRPAADRDDVDQRGREARGVPHNRFRRARRAADLPGRHRGGATAISAESRCRTCARRRRRRPPPLLRPARRRRQRQGLAVGGARHSPATPSACATRCRCRCRRGRPTVRRQPRHRRTRRGDHTSRQLAANSLVFSYAHQVRVVAPSAAAPSPVCRSAGRSSITCRRSTRTGCS